MEHLILESIVDVKSFIMQVPGCVMHPLAKAWTRPNPTAHFLHAAAAVAVVAASVVAVAGVVSVAGVVTTRISVEYLEIIAYAQREPERDKIMARLYCIMCLLDHQST